MLLLLLSVIFALVASCLCSLTEASLLSLSLGDIAELCERQPRIGRIWRTFRESIHRPISVILIVNTLAVAIGASFSGTQFSSLYGPRWLAAYSLLFSALMIIFGEILPKTLGVRFNRIVARVAAFPLKAGVELLSPLLWLVSLLTRPFLGKRQVTADAAEEITILARYAALSRTITGQQERIVSRGINLSHTRVKEIMVARDDIKFLSTDMSLAQALVASHVHHHTRYLLVRGSDTDNVAGYVNFKDIVSALQLNPANPTLEGIARPILDVEVLENLASVLRKMTGGHHHMAVVRDTRGATVGLITLEDIVESLIGSIQDEYDIAPAHVRPVAEGRYLVGGGATLHLLREKTGADLPDTAQTLDEWLRTEVMRHKPQAEERIRTGNAEFTVKKCRRSRLFELALEIKAASGAAAASPSRI